MARSNGQGKSVLHYGCMGCGAIVVFVVVVVGGLALFGWMQARGEKLEEREVAPALTIAPPVEPAPGEAASEAPIAPSAPPGKIVLDLEGTEFEVRAGAPGESLHADAKYDPTSYTLEQSEDRAPDGSWTWTFRFQRSGGGFVTMLKELFGGTKPKVEIVLPRGVPFALDTRIAQGGLQANLGGLWLTEVDLDGSMGGVAVDFSEPAPVPADRFAARGSMGGWAIQRIGNLSPREFEFDSSMGGTALDFRGAWQADAVVRVANRRGGMALVVPADLPVTGLENLQGGGGSPRAPAPDDEGRRPTLAFTVSGDLDNVEVGRK